MVSDTALGRSPPYTATELVNTTRGRLPGGPAGLEQMPRRIDVDPHAEVEIRFRHAADDRREVKDR